MSTDRPKLMFKIELLKETDVKFTLLSVMNGQSPIKGASKFYFSNNNWTVYYGTSFSVNKRNVISLPQTSLRQETKVHFNNDTERRDFLKGMAHALEDWSNSYIFKGVNKQTNIKFHKSLWIIF
jgi:hypothetical protein